jgi:hypothetical protein
VLFGVAMLALVGVSYAYFSVPEPEKPLRRFSFAPDGFAQNSSSISPDGKFILYRTGATGTGVQTSLWLRSLENESARELAGTAGADPWGLLVSRQPVDRLWHWYRIEESLDRWRRLDYAL